MAQRHIQLFRNGVPSFDALRDTHAKVVAFLIGADSPLTELDVRDGELVLYRYRLTEDGDIHTIVLAVSFPENGNKTFEVVANYDHLTNLITDLNTTESDSNDRGDITVTVKQVDGLLTNVTVSDNLAEVAHTGNAANVAVADTTVIAATTVEDALVEIAAEIDDMDLDATDVVSVSNAEFKASQISEEDGQVTVEDSAVLFGFTSQPDNENNKVVTEAELATATAYTGDNGIKIDENLVVSTNFKFNLATIPTTTEGVTTYNTMLSILDNNDNAVLAEVNVNELVKDSFLKSAGKDDTTNELVFVFAEDNGIGDGTITESEVRIPIKELCDVYTTDNVYLQLNATDKYKIEHKEQTGLPTAAQGIAAAVTVTGEYAETKTFKVPQLTVDAAGHVTVLNEKEVSITLPAKQNVFTTIKTDSGDANAITADSAESSISILGSDEINVTNENNVITVAHEAHAVTVPDLTANTSPVKTFKVPQLTVNGAGHVTAVENVEYTIDCNVTTVSGTAGQIVVTPTEAGEDVNYQVSLAAVSQNNSTAEHNFTDNEPNTTKVISGVSVDAYGRVTGLQTMTINEDYDCGQY